MGSERRNGIPRAAATSRNDRINARSRGLSFSRVWLPRAKNPGLSSGLRPGGEKIDTLYQGEGHQNHEQHHDENQMRSLYSLPVRILPSQP
jgi:hypothetical protein